MNTSKLKFYKFPVSMTKDEILDNLLEIDIASGFVTQNVMPRWWDTLPDSERMFWVLNTRTRTPYEAFFVFSEAVKDCFYFLPADVQDDLRKEYEENTEKVYVKMWKSAKKKNPTMPEKDITIGTYFFFYISERMTARIREFME